MNLSTIYNWIYTATSFDANHVIRENGNGPVPSGDFATYGIVSIDLPDYEYKEKIPIIEDEVEDDEQATLQVFTRAKFVISVNVYARNGYNVLNQLKLSKHNPIIRDIFTLANIALTGRSGVRDLTVLGDTVHKYRFQADFDIMANEIDSFTIERIKQYYINGYWNEDEITIDVPKETGD